MSSEKIFTKAFLAQFRPYTKWVIILHNYERKDGPEIKHQAKVLKGSLKSKGKSKGKTKARILKNAHQTPKKGRKGKKTTYPSPAKIVIAKTGKKGRYITKPLHKKTGRPVRTVRKYHKPDKRSSHKAGKKGRKMGRK